jgi:hypothetical protein
MKVYGLPLSKVIGENGDKIQKIKSYALNPIAFLESHAFLPWIVAAVRILYTAHRVEIYKQYLALAERNRMRFTNVDDEARIDAVRNHFKRVIQPHFASQFTSCGNTHQARLEAIEYQMREVFLEAIKQEAQTREGDIAAQAVLAFINALTDEEKKRLLQGDDNQFMEKARRHFNDSTSAAQTAWRAYDRWANVSGGWPNLLTPPLEGPDKAAYTVAAVGLERPTTKMASDLSREMIAYSFLLVMDQGDGDEEIRATRKTAFIAKVAEIRRAHNAKDEEEDDPSCLPGTISRAGDMWIAHSKSIIPDAPKLLEEELRSLVIEQFQKAPKSDQTDLHNALIMLSMYNDELKNFVKDLAQEATTEHTDLYNALVMLSSYNVDDVIKGKVVFTEEQNRLRQTFIDRLGNYQQLKSALDTRLCARGSRALSPAEYDVYVPALLADIGGPWIVQHLTALFRSSPKLENPYAYTSSQKEIPQQAAVTMLMEILAPIDVENKLTFIWNVSQLVASGKITLAQNALTPLGVSANAINEAVAKIEEERKRSAEKRQRKAALWDILYKALQNSSITDINEVLKEVVDEVIDGGQDLVATLQQRNIKLP